MYQVIDPKNSSPLLSENRRSPFLSPFVKTNSFMRFVLARVKNLAIAVSSQTTGTYQHICDQAKDLYRVRKDKGEWPPADTPQDKQLLPKPYANVAVDSPNRSLTAADVLLLIHNANKKSDRKSNVTCYICGQKGHYKSECPSLKNQLPGVPAKRGDPASKGWKRTPPGPNDPSTKIVKGKSFHWCAKCVRWSITHDTATHRGKESDATPQVNLAVDPSAWLFDFSLLSCLGTMLQWIFKCILFFFLEPHFIRIYNVLSTLDWKPSLTWCAPLLWSLLVFGIHFLSTVKKEDDLKRKDKRHLYKHFKPKWKPKQFHCTRTRFTRTIRVNETFISARDIKP